MRIAVILLMVVARGLLRLPAQRTLISHRKRHLKVALKEKT